MRGIWGPVLCAAVLVLPAWGQDAGSAAAAVPDAPAPVGSETNPMKVSSGVMMALSISTPRPAYPRYRRDDPAQQGSGTSVVRATISPEGKVVRVEWVSGTPAYRGPVTDAVLRWTFKPYLLNGGPVWVKTVITMDVLMGA